MRSENQKLGLATETEKAKGKELGYSVRPGKLKKQADFAWALPGKPPHEATKL